MNAMAVFQIEPVIGNPEEIHESALKHLGVILDDKNDSLSFFNILQFVPVLNFWQVHWYGRPSKSGSFFPLNWV